MLKKKTNCTSIVSESPCLTFDCFVEISEYYTIFRMMNACHDVNRFPFFLYSVMEVGALDKLASGNCWVP